MRRDQGAAEGHAIHAHSRAENHHRYGHAIRKWQPNQAASAKVIEWLEKRLMIGRRFGLAQNVLRDLSDTV